MRLHGWHVKAFVGKPGREGKFVAVGNAQRGRRGLAKLARSQQSEQPIARVDTQIHNARGLWWWLLLSTGTSTGIVKSRCRIGLAIGRLDKQVLLQQRILRTQLVGRLQVGQSTNPLLHEATRRDGVGKQVSAGQVQDPVARKFRGRARIQIHHAGSLQLRYYCHWLLLLLLLFRAVVVVVVAVIVTSTTVLQLQQQRKFSRQGRPQLVQQGLRESVGDIGIGALAEFQVQIEPHGRGSGNQFVAVPRFRARFAPVQVHPAPRVSRNVFALSRGGFFGGKQAGFHAPQCGRRGEYRASVLDGNGSLNGLFVHKGLSA